MATSPHKSNTKFGRRSSSRGRTRGGRHFADFTPKGLPMVWTHTLVNVRHFIKSYSFALSVTAVLAVVVVGAVLLRVSQRSSLANLLATVTSVTQDYRSLVSGDTTNAPERSDNVDDGILGNAPAGTPSSTTFTFSPNGDDQDANGGNEPTPSGPFAAAITSFSQTDEVLECSTKNIVRPKCAKRYEFNATVSTQDGPGLVAFGWRTNVSGANENDSYSAANGTSSQNLQKAVTIPCLDNGNYSMQFVILAPSQVQSTTLTFNHNCLSI